MDHIDSGTAGRLTGQGYHRHGKPWQGKFEGWDNWENTFIATYEGGECKKREYFNFYTYNLERRIEFLKDSKIRITHWDEHGKVLSEKVYKEQFQFFR